MSVDGTRRVYTRRSRTILASLALFGFSVAAAGLGSELAVGDVSTGRGFTIGLFTVGLLVALRLMRMAVVVTPGCVTLRGFWRSCSLPAADVLGFEPPQPYGTVRHAGLGVVLTNGRYASAGVFGRGKLDDDSVGDAECAELNLWLSHQRKSATTVPALPTRHGVTGAAAFAWSVWLAFLALLLLLCGAMVVDTLVSMDGSDLGAAAGR